MDAAQTNLVLDLVSTQTTLAAGDTLTVVREIGQSSIQGIDWDMSCASAPTLTLTVKSSNGGTSGPFVAWTSAPGTSMTSSFNTTSAIPAGETTRYCGGTDLRLFPANVVQWTIYNPGAATITINRISMFVY